MIAGIEGNFLSNNKYLVRFAQSDKDMEAAQSLRFRVFNLELGEGLENSYQHQLDTDKFDEQCHHLLVVHRKTGEVIGTYRMQSYDMAGRNHGFYTGREFCLDTIPADILNASVEVGRACIDADHRNGRVLYLLWRGLAKYLDHFNKNYLFGCCSLTSQSPEEAWTVMAYLKKSGYTNPDWMVSTTDDYSCPQTKANPQNIDDTKLPQLFRLYLNLGAKVCSPPAQDRAFKTIDYLVMLDISCLDERTRMLFFS